MFWNILTIVSMLVLGILLLFSHKEERNWVGNKYKYTDCGRVKFQLWIYVLDIALSFIPILNIIVAIASIITYVIQYHDDDYERLYIKNRLFSNINKLFIKIKEFLTKEL